MTDCKLDLLQKFPEFSDERGTLVVWENQELPFVPARTFMISNVPEGQIRANHSVSCDLMLVAIAGSVKVVMDKNYTVLLNKKTEGFLIKKDTYIELKEFSAHALVLVFAEKPFVNTVYSLK